MARPKAPAAAVRKAPPIAMAGSTAIYRPQRPSNPNTDRNSIAKPWQIEAYRQVNICGEARYAVTIFAAMAARAAIGITEPTALPGGSVTWIDSGPEVEALMALAPTVRERSKLIRDYMLHYTVAGECYLLARERVDTDPDFVPPPEGYLKWDDYLLEQVGTLDPFDPDYEEQLDEIDALNPNTYIWEIVAVTEIQKVGKTWRVRHDNGIFLELAPDDPVIRLWNPDPEDRREAWSSFRALLPVLREIEYLSKHIFTQVRARLMSAGVWFLPENLTFPPPPADAVEGGAEAIALMNEAEQFMLSLANASMDFLDADEVAFPSIVMANPEALTAIDQKKLIQFWSTIDDKAMILRSDAIRRFALGMDLPPEQVLGSSGLIGGGSGRGTTGSVNHWGMWANEEQTISTHIEPALDIFVSSLTSGYLRSVVENTEKVVGYDTATLRLKQDRSKEALEWYDRGVLKAAVALKENGFDPDTDMMTKQEYQTWLTNKVATGTVAPEQIQAALKVLGVDLELEPLPGAAGGYEDGSGPAVSGNPAPKGISNGNGAPSLETHPKADGKPTEQHDHSAAPYAVREAKCEALVLRALEKAGNRLLNDGRRGRDKDRTTPAHMAHITATLSDTGWSASDFDFSLAATVFDGASAAELRDLTAKMGAFCADLYNNQRPYAHSDLMGVLRG
jgi:hypothetical protein